MTNQLKERIAVFLVIGALAVGVLFAVMANTGAAYGDPRDKADGYRQGLLSEAGSESSWQDAVKVDLAGTPHWQSSVKPDITYVPAWQTDVKPVITITVPR